MKSLLYECYGCKKPRTSKDPFIGFKKANLPLCKSCYDWMKWAVSDEDE